MVMTTALRPHFRLECPVATAPATANLLAQIFVRKVAAGPSKTQNTPTDDPGMKVSKHDVPPVSG